MSKITFLALLSCVVLMTACQSTTITSTDDYDSQRHARIRLYGQNQKPTIMEYVYNNKPVRKNVGGTLSDAFSSFAGSTENISMGMPKTAMINAMRQYDGILSKVFYREFAVPAGVPVRVHNAFIGMLYYTSSPIDNFDYVKKVSCKSNIVTFTPQAGKDYEVVPAHNSEACGVAVLQVSSHDNPE